MKASGIAARLGIAALVAALGAASMWAAGSVERRPHVESTGERAVNEGATDPGDIRAHNSPALARSPGRPGHLAVANRIDTPDYSCALHTSRDGGASWRRVPVPVPRRAGRKCYAPDVAYAADGTLHLSFVTLRGRGNTPGAAWATRSTDGGRTLQPPRRVAGALTFGLRLAVDPRRPGRLYLTWLQAVATGQFRFAAPGNRIVVARSDDGGRNWGRPIPVSDPERERVLAPAPAVGGDGSLYVLHLDLGDDRLDYEAGHGGAGGPPYGGRFALLLARSGDAGRSWEESVVDDAIVPTRRFIALLPPTPSLAVDGASGRVYAAFEDGRDGGADVRLWSLASGAARWEGPTRVNDTPAGERTWQYLPRIAVAPSGRLDVVYYDRRADPANRMNSVSAQSSTDGGRSFGPSAPLSSRSFDSGVGLGSEVGLPDLGNRLGLASDDAGLVAAWADTRAGTVASNKQDIAFAGATVREPAALAGPLQALLRYGGAAVLLAAAALALTVARRRERPGALSARS